MKQFLLKLWQDETGAETAEWVVIVGLILAVAITIYTGVLQDALSQLVTRISTIIGTVAPTT
jgi:Flp pilus assembly pilin Flp